MHFSEFMAIGLKKKKIIHENTRSPLYSYNVPGRWRLLDAQTESFFEVPSKRARVKYLPKFPRGFYTFLFQSTDITTGYHENNDASENPEM